MIEKKQCPSAGELRQMLHGELAGADSEMLQRHLATCATCAQTLTRLRRDDPGARRPEPGTLQVPDPGEHRTASGTTAAPPHTEPASRRDRARSVAGILAPPQQEGEMGRLGSYRVLEVLGQGGMGVVFRAEDTRLHRIVALKAMLPEMADRPDARERFLREARTAASIEHDNIVTIYQVDEDRGVPYIAMPLLRGSSLEDWLRSRPGQAGAPVATAQVLRIAREVARGLAAAHEKGLIHRDIKPANIWLDSGAGGRARILDFGLARLATGDQHLTQSGVILGTPAYMAPEQARADTIDGRADLFSLGVVLYRLCTGVLPFRGEDTMSTLLAIALNTPAPPIQLNPALPRPLSDLVMRLLQKDPRDRPGSAQELLHLLQGIERDLTAETPCVDTTQALPAPGPLARPALAPAAPRKRRWALAACVAALLAGLGLAGVVLFLQTGAGVVRIEIDDPDIKVAVDQDAFRITGAGAHDIVLAPGEHGLRIRRGDLELETDRFVLKKRGKVTLRVEWLDGKLQVVQGDRVIGQKGAPTAAGPSPVEPPAARADAAAPAAPPTVTASALFNGKDLTGWTSARGGTGDWRVVDGLLTCEGPRDHLLTVRDDFADFHLRAEVKLNAEGNSGIYFRAGKPLALIGDYEAQVANNAEEFYRTGSLYGLVRVSESPVPPDTWLTVEVIAVGKRIRILVNGKETADFTETREGHRARGCIALQHREEVTRVFFRKIEVRELTPAEGAALFGSDPWTLLFNGQDLTGWQPVGHDGWKVSGGLLVGETDEAVGWLMSRREFGDFELDLEYLLSSGSNSGIFLRAWPDGAVNGADFHEIQLLDDTAPRHADIPDNVRTGSLFKQIAASPVLRPEPGKWHRLNVVVRGRQVRVRLNGFQVVDGPLPPGKPDRGRIGLQLYPSLVQLRNIRVRELND